MSVDRWGRPPPGHLYVVAASQSDDDSTIMITTAPPHDITSALHPIVMVIGAREWPDANVDVFYMPNSAKVSYPQQPALLEHIYCPLHVFRAIA